MRRGRDLRRFARRQALRARARRTGALELLDRGADLLLVARRRLVESDREIDDAVFFSPTFDAFLEHGILLRTQMKNCGF